MKLHKLQVPFYFILFLRFVGVLRSSSSRLLSLSASSVFLAGLVVFPFHTQSFLLLLPHPISLSLFSTFFLAAASSPLSLVSHRSVVLKFNGRVRRRLEKREFLLIGKPLR